MAGAYAILALLNAISGGNNNIKHDKEEAGRVVRREQR